MLDNIAASLSANVALRALQAIFAVIVLGTDAYSVHVFRGHVVNEEFVFGNFTDYLGVPDAWSFLLFCSGWTILGVIFLVVAGIHYAGHRIIGYLSVAVETIALLSWLAGFVAVAVNIGTTDCPAEEHGCGAITAATVFGGLEWLLFVMTTLLTTKLVFNAPRRTSKAEATTSTPGPEMTTV
ncbi:hypothetical protein SCUCBS95973_004455 [Sporothrix curviconia]|uniref:MARVEL domain-containing protein n=1 Tax=Sporothrix curviconia TaxID=1260050 RepID=A0ABP0BQ59_9PEZI